jgi:hypothetical protein
MMTDVKKIMWSLFLLFTNTFYAYSQAVPSLDEKFPFLMTFSKSAEKKWGDDDFVQTIFFVVPESTKNPVYIRVFDPDLGGQNDENRSGFDSKTKFSVYGGKGAHSHPDSRSIEPNGNYKSGTLITTKTFATDESTDNKWIAFGPFNPNEGEYQAENGGYVFKLVIEGLNGDDGNLYKLFFSKQMDTNIPVDGGNSFCYEYSIRLPDAKASVSHIYPFLPANLVAIKINIFDYDDEGNVRTVTISKKGNVLNASTEAVWSTTKIDISKEELNTSMDIQFIKKKEVKNNNIVVYITNQYNEAIPFYSAPIGGVPKYKYKIEVIKTK